MASFDTFSPYEKISVIFGCLLGIATVAGISVGIFYKVYIILDKRREKRSELKIAFYDFKDEVNLKINGMQTDITANVQRLDIQGQHFDVNDKNIDRATDLALFSLKQTGFNLSSRKND